MADGSRSFILLSLAAILFIGLGQILTLPPFEGFDETHHYSSIRQITDTGTLPLLGRSFIVSDVDEYRRLGPLPYDLPVARAEGSSRFGHDEITVYEDFFAKPERIAAYKQKYRDAVFHGSDGVSKNYNWEAQHPPFYYLAMAPVLKAAGGLSFAGQFLSLRLASFLLAFAGLAIGLLGALKYDDGDLPRPLIIGGYFMCPLILPMFYPEFGRLGNDSLVAFLFGCLWLLTLRWRQMRDEVKSGIAIGLCIGLGLITKSAFAPLAIGFGLFALAAIKREGNKRSGMGMLAVAVLISALFAAGWIFYQHVIAHSVVNSLDVLVLEQKGGILENLRANFSISGLLEKFFYILVSWSWFGTQSNAYIGVAHFPLLILFVWIGINYLCALRGRLLLSAAWLPLWFGLPFFVALLLQTLLAMARVKGGMLGSYLQVLAPAYGLAFGYGIQRIMRSRWRRVVLAAFLVYSVGFLAFVNWAQITLFGGCSIRSPGYSYGFPNDTYCIDRFDTVINNLSVLGWGWAGFICFTLGLLCLSFGVFRLFLMNRSTNSPHA